VTKRLKNAAKRLKKGTKRLRNAAKRLKNETKRLKNAAKRLKKMNLLTVLAGLWRR